MNMHDCTIEFIKRVHPLLFSKYRIISIQRSKILLSYVYQNKNI